MITIIEATEQHRAPWLELRLALWPDCLHDESDQDITEILRNARLSAFLAIDKNGISVGFMEVSTRDYVDGATTSPVGYVEGIYIRPTHRHKGIGTQLVRAAEAWTRSRGLSELGSDTHISNANSISFHTATGFKETDHIVVFIKNLND